MNNIDARYQGLLEDILHWGVKKTDRTGTGTISVFGRQIRHKMSEGFPLLTTKKMAWKTMVTELLWFLRGDTNIKFLLDYDCHIWDGDAWENYRRKTLEKFVNDDTSIAGYTITNKEDFINKIKTDDEFAKKWGEVGSIYGKQWRDWSGKNEVKLTNERDENGYLKFNTIHIPGVDQIQSLINELKTNPDSRRLMVNAWNVGELPTMVLPPCHYGFQVYTRELSLKERCDAYMKWSNDPKCVEWKNHIENEMGWDYEKPDWVFKEVREQLDKAQFPTRAISLMWNQRSVDTFLGLPFNIASYGLLLEIIAKEVNMVADELIGNLGDTHLYLNHIEQAKEQISRTPYELPKLQINDLRSDTNSIIRDTTKWSYKDFQIEDYKYHPAIKAPLSN